MPIQWDSTDTKQQQYPRHVIEVRLKQYKTARI